MAGIPNPESLSVKTMTRISEELYCLESRAVRGELSNLQTFDELRRIRQDLEPHIAAPHDTPGKGTEQEEGTVPAALTGDQTLA